MSKGIIDNKQTGLVGDVLKNSISKGSKISIVATHFTFVFVKLKKELGQRWMVTSLILQDIV